MEIFLESSLCGMGYLNISHIGSIECLEWNQNWKRIQNGNFWQNIGNQTALGSISKRFMVLQIVGRAIFPICINIEMMSLCMHKQ